MSGDRRATNELLTGRKGRQTRARKTGPGHRTEIGANPLIYDYEQGPFFHLGVRPFPPEAVELLERRTGRPFDAAFLADWERIRAFLGYEGIELAPSLLTARRLEDGEDRGEPVAPPISTRLAYQSERPEIPTVATPLTGGPDPEDLGD